ncbi:MAG: hypothetical protein UU05_C0034G0006, partial [Candidatus Curtissbacteria bacterium GW2011_GWA1_40_47]
MYPAQTSFIPVIVAIVRFTEEHGFGGLYPFWYLGSTPVKYLTGPVVPSLLTALHKVLGGVSLFDLSFFLILTSFLVSSVGWGMLAWQLSGRRIYCYIVGLLTLFAPWHWISAFALSDVSAILATALTPWVLLAFVYSLDINNFQFIIFNFHSIFKFKFLNIKNSLIISNLKLKILFPALLFALLLLTNTTASIPAIIGLIILGVIMYKKWELGLKRVGLVILLGWFLTLWWYPPNYWLTLLAAPSIGGSSAAGTLIHLVNLMRGFVPVILAIFLVAWGVGKKDLFGKFSLSWFSVFGLLTLFRFFGDVKFWLDWTSWIGEVEIGLVLLFARNFQFSLFNFQSNHNFKFLNIKNPIFYLLFTIYLVLGWFFAWQNRSFWLPRSNIDNTVEYKIANWLSNNLTMKQLNNSPTVFLSGSTAFWLNALVDVRQVRGGVDQVSQDPSWRQAVWEIREGATAEGTERVLKELKINYIVVHTEQSDEFYHDFKYPEKFGQIPSLEKIYDQEGDVIYEIK